MSMTAEGNNSDASARDGRVQAFSYLPKRATRRPAQRPADGPKYLAKDIADLAVFGIL